MQIIFLALAQTVWQTMPALTVYVATINLSTVMLSLYWTISLTAINSILAMILIYISSLHLKMYTLNIENMKLLDGMHEGLLILSKQHQKQVMFCNKPSQKFLEKALQNTETQSTDEQEEDKILNPLIFKPIKVTSQNGLSQSFRHKLDRIQSRSECLSLDQIITVQVDEPHQKNCIYEIQLNNQTKFTQIRVKSILFLQEEAYAVYFYDVTHHIESIKLENRVLQQSEEYKHQVNYEMTLSNELRSLLTSCLVTLESIVGQASIPLHFWQLQMFIISKVNFSLSLINDALDLKLIEDKKFIPKIEAFSLKDTFDFIQKIFEPLRQV